MIRTALLLLALAAAPAWAQQDGPHALQRMPPVYPVLGQAYEVTASCPAIFDITPEGATANICVVCAISAELPPTAMRTMTGYFVTAAEEAVSVWRYEASETGWRAFETVVFFTLSNPDGSQMRTPDEPDTASCLDRPIA